MSDGIAEIASTIGWDGLIEEVRMALSTLRADDLEELAARAERMLVKGVGQEWLLHGKPQLRERKRASLTQEHRLLGNLLVATDRNLEVLRWLRDGAGEGIDARGVNTRWVR